LPFWSTLLDLPHNVILIRLHLIQLPLVSPSHPPFHPINLLTPSPHSACIASNTTVLSEHASPASTSQTSALAAAILPKISHDSPQKLTYTHDRLFVHYIADSSSVSPSTDANTEPSSGAPLTFLVVAQASLGRRIPFAFLLECKKKFLKQYDPETTEFESLPSYGAAAFNSTLKGLVSTYNDSPPEDSLGAAKKEIEDVRHIMTENIERVLERGERIDLLVDKTDRLGGSAREFRVRSRGLRRKMWWKNVRLMVLLGVVVAFLLYLMIGAGCGLPAWGKCVG
jgi:vesicle-associated membrane protein 7